MALPSLERKQYKLGKYDIVAQPLLGSAHMLRYTVMLNGKRIGALMSVPNESDCRFMENPPATPPLQPFIYMYRPGRPKKGAPPRTVDALTPPRDELPHGMDLPTRTDER